ncbi:hypothetical protein A9Q81_23860 [Gammaproteobacteria bacterium 42_54_T18]|nr:hypothetical protein A9Q81_23860 [Gammaproteobacteria bacterium 42_54_T18]
MWGNLTPVFGADVDLENINTAYLFDDTDIIQLLPHSLSFVENKTLSFSNVYHSESWRPIKSNSINLGVTSSALWITASISSKNLRERQQFYLRFSNPELSDIKVYQDKKLISAPGQYYGFNNREVSLPEFVIPIVFTKNNTTTLTVRIASSGSLRTGVTLHSVNHLFSMQNQQSLVVGGYFGLACLLCLLFFMFFMFSKERIYLWVSTSLGSLIILQLNMDGFLYHYGYQEHPDWFFSFLLIPTIIAYISTFLVAIDFFYLKEKNKPMFTLLAVHVYVGITLLLGWTFLSNAMILYFTIPYIFTGGISCIFVCITNIDRKNYSSIYYVSAMILASMGSLCYVSLYIGLIPSTPFFESIFKITSTIGIALISVSLFRRYQESKLTLKREKEKILKSLVRANKIKDEFLSVVSHELRTPMNGVEGALDLVKDYQLPEYVSKYIAMARHSSEDMVTMINNILDYTELNEEIDPNIGKFNLVDDMDNLINVMKTRFLQQQAKIKFAPTPNVAGVYQGDSKLLFKALRHILSNAMKFTSKGSIHVSLRTIPDQGNDIADMIELIVTDTGEGIDQSNLDVLFEGFSQQDASMVRKFRGLGLGLPLTKAFTRILGGEMFIDTKEGKGTMVTLILPLTVVQRERVQKPVNSKKCEGLEMLVVEDNIVNQKILVAIIKKLGHTAVTADNGSVAVELAKNKQFDFVWMDCQMPIMDGFDATRLIRNFLPYKDTPIVAVTANALSQDERNCISAGMSGFLVKPVNRNAVERVVEKWISSQ